MAYSARFVIVAVAVAAVLGALYYAFYRRHATQRVQSETPGRPLPSVASVVRVLLIAALVAIAVCATVTSPDQPPDPSRNEYETIDLSTPNTAVYDSYENSLLPPYTDRGDASYALAYSVDENPGYSRRVVEQNGWTFTVFTRDGAGDAFHPDFLCFVEPSDTIATSGDFAMAGSFVESATQTQRSSSGAAGGTMPSRLLVLGNLADGYEFRFDVGTLTEQDLDAFQQADDPEADVMDFAQNRASVTIALK